MKPGVPTVSSRCATNACVEVTLTDRVTVRDSAGAAVAFRPADWRSFVTTLQEESV